MTCPNALDKEIALLKQRQDFTESMVTRLVTTCERIDQTLGRMANYEQRQLEIIEHISEMRKDITEVKINIPQNAGARLQELEKDVLPLKEARGWFILAFIALFGMMSAGYFEMFTK